MALELALDEKTGKRPEEWEELVSSLNASGSTWDWSKVEVRKVQPRVGASVYVSPGVFAVGEEPVPPAPPEPGDAEEAEPPAPPAPVVVFEVGDVVGPLGGMLRRKKRYMAQHYGDELWFFHDPLAHELPLRIQSTELRTEAMVLDMSGEGSNRLRYLRDQRADPLDMSQVLPQSYEDVVAMTDVSTSDVALWPKRSAMQRINSRSLPQETPSPSATAASLPGLLSPSSARPDSPKTLTSTMSSVVEALPPLEANCKIVDVHVQGWPYSFVVATATIYKDEELLIDRGEEFWERQRSVLERLRVLAPGLEEILTGVTLPEPLPPDPAGAFPPRAPHTRPSSKPKEPRDFIPDFTSFIGAFALKSGAKEAEKLPSEAERIRQLCRRLGDCSSSGTTSGKRRGVQLSTEFRHSELSIAAAGPRQSYAQPVPCCACCAAAAVLAATAFDLGCQLGARHLQFPVALPQCPTTAFGEPLATASLQLFGATFRTAGYLTAALHQGAQTLKNSWSHGPTVPIQPDTLDPAGPGQMVMASEALQRSCVAQKWNAPARWEYTSLARCWKFHCSMLKGKTKMRSLDWCCNVL
ncbi:unnamed protein product [Cladocopium goreaui]|uniref:SET domain-containing protein n=1 Tax=Cladocopium goreaui TaxID=2562237 RepID=A0A9P1CT69_9DINO|nr:unnamed protein product [Cladocopium goreaui]